MTKNFLLLAGILGLILTATAVSAAPAIAPKVINTPKAATSTPKQTKCKLVQQKVNLIATRHDGNKERRKNAYDNLIGRLEKLDAKLIAKGYDTAKLKADLVVLKQKIAKFVVDYKAYNDARKAAYEYVCAKTDAQFQTKIKETRTLFATVRSDALDIRTYYQTTIKKDLKDIKAQKVKNATSTPATGATSTIAQ